MTIEQADKIISLLGELNGKASVALLVLGAMVGLLLVTFIAKVFYK